MTAASFDFGKCGLKRYFISNCTVVTNYVTSKYFSMEFIGSSGSAVLKG